jgi:hypothetical protein
VVTTVTIAVTGRVARRAKAESPIEWIIFCIFIALSPFQRMMDLGHESLATTFWPNGLVFGQWKTIVGRQPVRRYNPFKSFPLHEVNGKKRTLPGVVSTSTDAQQLRLVARITAALLAPNFAL